MKKTLYENDSVKDQLFEIDGKKIRLTNLTAVVSMMGLICCYVDNEIYFTNDKNNSTINNSIRIVALLTTIILIMMVFRYYMFCVQQLKLQKIVHPRTSVFQTSLRYQFYLEMLANIIVYPPFLDLQIEHNFNGITYNIPANAYFFSFMLMRLYILLRIFQQNTFWNTAKAQRVCRMNDFSANLMFTIRSNLMTNPFTVVTVVLLVLILVFGVAIRNLERYQDVPLRIFQFDNMWNCFWCIVLVMTTIGYGDIYPISIGGRFIVILAGISGFLILSMLLNILSALTQLQPNEDWAFQTLVSRKEINKELYVDSAILIQKHYRIRRLRKQRVQVRKRLRLVMDTTAMHKRLRLKRKQIQTNKIELKDIINKIGSNYECEIDKVKEEISDLQDLRENVEECLSLQRGLNSKVLLIFRNQKYLYELAQNNFIQSD